MEKEETYTWPDSFVLPHFVIIAVLHVLLDKTELDNAVKKHCKTGLKVVGIAHTDWAYNTGLNLLYKKEYDSFFRLFPLIYFDHRELIPANMIIDNIEQSIKANKVLCVDS